MKLLHKELKIYRGRYTEIMEAETKDMAWYLSWDTGEIFVGNAVGEKVSYSGGKGLTNNQIKQLIVEQLTTEGIGADVSRIKNLLTQNNINFNDIRTLSENTLNAVNDYDITLNTKVESAVSTMLAEWEQNDLGDLYFNKIETLTEIDNKLAAVNVSGLATKLELEVLEGLLSDKVSDDNFQLYKDEITPYKSIKTISTVQSNDLTELIGNDRLEAGIYKIRFVGIGWCLLLVDSVNISRVTPSGKIELYNIASKTWSLYLDVSTILSVNGKFPENGLIEITADDINNTASRAWNNLLPQTIDTGGTYINAINPLGRKENLDIGDYSIAFGYDSSAAGNNSIAIGKGSEISDIGENSIQLGTGTNSVPNSINIWDYQLLKIIEDSKGNKKGFIPTERLVERFYEASIIIQPSDWSELKYNASIENMTENALVWVSPAAGSFDDYSMDGIRATSQSFNTLNFECIKNPDTSIIVNVIWRV